jgi:hypothetical protein
VGQKERGVNWVSILKFLRAPGDKTDGATTSAASQPPDASIPQCGDASASLAPSPRDIPRRAQMLMDAANIVIERGNSYGPPARHFERTVRLINAYFGTSFRPEDWGKIIMLDKLARDLETPKADNLVDIAGYAACVHEIRSRQ